MATGIAKKPLIFLASAPDAAAEERTASEAAQWIRV
jgi:hypothetical protein